MRKVLIAGLSAALLLAIPVSDGEAQRGNRRGDQPNRQQLEQRLRERLATMLRTQLGLTNEQLQQLSEVNQRFDARRRDLVRREFDIRRSLRAEIMRGDQADQAKVEGLLGGQFRIERERIDIDEAEQRDLGRFLTAVQRARYRGLQEQFRREIDQLRGRGRPGLGPPDTGQRRPPPG